MTIHCFLLTLINIIQGPKELAGYGKTLSWDGEQSSHNLKSA